ncbi:phage tail protein [Moraxella atlantae]|nr:GpE family phage tail protein [Moraxella atlantae]OPH35217.1 phage tail protein [Moraxella atlantae]
MADLAVVFHWTPDTCHAMPLDELMTWHDKARERSQVKK